MATPCRHHLCAAARQCLTSRSCEASQVLRGVPIETEVVAEPSSRAVGDGTGILMLAETTTGCLLGASGIGERGVSAEQVAGAAADELIAAVESGACVDQW